MNDMNAQEVALLFLFSQFVPRSVSKKAPASAAGSAAQSAAAKRLAQLSKLKELGMQRVSKK